MGFRGIERVTGINHNTIINWVSVAGLSLPNAPKSDEIPEITELDELQTFVGAKKNKVWLWTAVNKKVAGILAWVVGDAKFGHFSVPLANCSGVGKAFGMPQTVMLFMPSLLMRFLTLLRRLIYLVLRERIQDLDII
jgi:hypothetical protein